MTCHQDARGHFVKLHGLNTCCFIFSGIDHTVLNGVIDLVVSNDGGRHAHSGEGAAPDGCALNAYFQIFEIGQIAGSFVGENIANAAARIANQTDFGFLLDFIGNRLEQVLVKHFVPVIQVTEQKGRVDEGCCFRKSRHVGRRNNGVINGFALVHVSEVIFFETQFAVFVQYKIDRLAVVFFDQFFKFNHGFGKSVVVTKLGRAVERNRGLLRVGA